MARTAECAEHDVRLDTLESSSRNLRQELAVVQQDVKQLTLDIVGRLDNIKDGVADVRERVSRLEGKASVPPPSASPRRLHPAAVAGGAIGVLLAVAELLRASGAIRIAVGGGP